MAGTDKQAVLDGFGQELPDPTPIAVPAGFKRPETLAEQVQRLVRTHISREAAEAGMETFEESEDFDIPDDPDDPTTVYEEWFDPTLGRGITAEEFRTNHAIYRQRYLDAEEKAYQAMRQSNALRRKVDQEEAEMLGQNSSRAASERVKQSEGGNADPKEK